jgi:hypothetical protein
MNRHRREESKEHMPDQDMRKGTMKREKRDNRSEREREMHERDYGDHGPELD